MPFWDFLKPKPEPFLGPFNVRTLRFDDQAGGSLNITFPNNAYFILLEFHTLRDNAIVNFTNCAARLQIFRGGQEIYRTATPISGGTKFHLNAISGSSLSTAISNVPELMVPLPQPCLLYPADSLTVIADQNGVNMNMKETYATVKEYPLNQYT